MNFEKFIENTSINFNNKEKTIKLVEIKNLLTKHGLNIVSKVNLKTKFAFIPDNVWETLKVDEKKVYDGIPVVSIKYFEKIFEHKCFFNITSDLTLNSVTTNSIDNRHLFKCTDRSYDILEVITIINVKKIF